MDLDTWTKGAVASEIRSPGLRYDLRDRKIFPVRIMLVEGSHSKPHFVGDTQNMIHRMGQKFLIPTILPIKI